MRENRAMMNAMRSGVVVLGALAFGYLTLRLGFKPYLEKAQRTAELEQAQAQARAQAQAQSQSQLPEQPLDFVEPEFSSTIRDS